MKLVLLFVVFAFLIATAFGYGTLNEEWEKFKTDHSKTYDGQGHEACRKAIFADSLYKVKQHNIKYEAGEVSFEMGLNDYSDLTHEEFKLRT